jgi:hypothetical protein
LIVVRGLQAQHVIWSPCVTTSPSGPSDPIKISPLERAIEHLFKLHFLPNVRVGLHVLQRVSECVVAVGRLTSTELAQETLLVVRSEPVGKRDEC